MSSENVSKESMQRVMQFFNSLADETRLKILIQLTKGAANVNDIHHALGSESMTLSAVSHQLKMLSDLGMVISERRGKEKYFSLSDNFCWCILKDAFNHYHEGTHCEACKRLKDKPKEKVKHG